MLQGEKVRLRAYRRADIDAALEYMNTPEIARNLRPGVPFPLRHEDEVKWYESLDPMSDRTYSFAIETIEGGDYIGGCGVHEVDWKNSHGTVGIFLGKGYWDMGYGTDALRVLVRFIFEEMNLNKIKLNVYSFNTRAIRSYEKVGFKGDGVLREDLFREGRYHDVVVMSLLRREWGDR